jgi:hypothetical protein
MNSDKTTDATDTTRRSFLKTSAMAMTYMVGGKALLLTPAAAHAAQMPMKVLSALEVTTLETLCEAIVPGSRSAGIAAFVDYQLAEKPHNALLMGRYLGLEPPFAPFYQQGLAAAHQAALTQFDRPWSQLTESQSKSLVDQMFTDAIANWSAAPASFLFFVWRADACDVVYGTRSGSDAIGMPYMAHIAPSDKWLSAKELQK